MLEIQFRFKTAERRAAKAGTTSKNPYCPECAHIKSRQSQKMKRGNGFATGCF